jgi:hypothetical protein
MPVLGRPPSTAIGHPRRIPAWAAAAPGSGPGCGPPWGHAVLARRGGAGGTDGMPLPYDRDGRDEFGRLEVRRVVWERPTPALADRK